MTKSSLVEWISVGALAERTGVAVSALHFYERKGLIKSVRNSANHRQYPRHTIRIVSIIQVAQRTGFTLEEISRELDRLPNRQQLTLADWESLALRWREELNKKIHQLTELRDNMTSCIGCGCLSMQRCGLLNPDDELAQQGAGAQRLTG